MPNLEPINVTINNLDNNINVDVVNINAAFDKLKRYNRGFDFIYFDIEGSFEDITFLNGNYFIVGYIYTGDGKQRPFIVKFNSRLNVARSYYLNTEGMFKKVISDKSNYIYILGYNSENNYSFILKCNSELDIISNIIFDTLDEVYDIIWKDNNYSNIYISAKDTTDYRIVAIDSSTGSSISDGEIILASSDVPYIFTRSLQYESLDCCLGIGGLFDTSHPNRKLVIIRHPLLIHTEYTQGDLFYYDTAFPNVPYIDNISKVNFYIYKYDSANDIYYSNLLADYNYYDLFNDVRRYIAASFLISLNNVYVPLGGDIIYVKSDYDCGFNATLYIDSTFNMDAWITMNEDFAFISVGFYNGKPFVLKYINTVGVYESTNTLFPKVVQENLQISTSPSAPRSVDTVYVDEINTTLNPGYNKTTTTINSPQSSLIRYETNVKNHGHLITIPKEFKLYDIDVTSDKIYFCGGYKGDQKYGAFLGSISSRNFSNIKTIYRYVPCICYPYEMIDNTTFGIHEVHEGDEVIEDYENTVPLTVESFKIMYDKNNDSVYCIIKDYPANYKADTGHGASCSAYRWPIGAFVLDKDLNNTLKAIRFITFSSAPFLIVDRLWQGTVRLPGCSFITKDGAVTKFIFNTYIKEKYQTNCKTTDDPEFEGCSMALHLSQDECNLYLLYIDKIYPNQLDTAPVTYVDEDGTIYTAPVVGKNGDTFYAIYDTYDNNGNERSYVGTINNGVFTGIQFDLPDISPNMILNTDNYAYVICDKYVVEVTPDINSIRSAIGFNGYSITAAKIYDDKLYLILNGVNQFIVILNLPLPTVSIYDEELRFAIYNIPIRITDTRESNVDLVTISKEWPRGTIPPFIPSGHSCSNCDYLYLQPPFFEECNMTINWEEI